MEHGVKKQRTCSRGHAYTGNEPCSVCFPGYRTYRVRAKIWLYPGTAACWHFVTLPKKQSDQIKVRFGMFTRGWGSLPVRVTVGDTTWKTSIFPDKKSSAYLLPLKADVRKKEGIAVDETIALRLEIQDI